MSGSMLEGFVLPPDKSILHRLLIIGSLTDAVITVPLASDDLAEDVLATIGCLRALGVTIDIGPASLIIHGVCMDGWRAPLHPLDCRNSGTTARLLLGALCGRQFEVTLEGDASLSERPMRRLAVLLEHFGADVQTAVSGGLPTTVYPRSLHPISVSTGVASAQIKSALLFAALQTKGISHISEPSLSRDHTERMLQAFGVGLEKHNNTIEIASTRSIPLSGGPFIYDVPRDISAAYYLIAAGLLSKTPIKLSNVVLNPTRTRALEFMRQAFSIDVDNVTEAWNELRGDISVRTSELGKWSLEITKDDIPLTIDELPILAVLAACSSGELVVRNAGELRYKESDRIKLVVENLRKSGVNAEELEDGFVVRRGSPSTGNVQVSHGGDHRVAMAFAVMAAIGTAVTIPNPSVVNVSFPGYFQELEKIIGRGKLQFS